jgi:hypothetical protein
LDLAPPNACIEVGANATELEVRLTTTPRQADVDLYVRFGSPPSLAANAIMADYVSEGPTGDETIRITGGASPPLRPGVYFIALAVWTTGTPTSIVITATVR